MKSKKVLKTVKQRSFFYDVGKLVKRTAPENLKMFFPSIYLGFSR